ncbi:MAG TPA: hypothetical protein VD793_11175 [Gemmatimonadales bacterium]|nr:hypothetical protein [Gemmatimonadales bacterium]
MNHHAAEAAMFWVGALFVAVPLVFAGTLLAVWWHGRRRARREQMASSPPAGMPS